MNILSMLARIQTNLDLPNAAEKLLLVPPRPQHLTQELSEINLLVGYSNSENSQMALDLTLWIALQTRLATRKPVTVQVVYVTEEVDLSIASERRYVPSDPAGSSHPFAGGSSAAATLAPAKLAAISRAEQFEQADSILWQARSLAKEWRGSLKTHLRFGDIAIELGAVAAAEATTLLILGCKSRNAGLIRRLGADFPCPVLGIPETFDLDQPI